MNCLEGLSILTSNKTGKNVEDFDGMLDGILQNTSHLVSAEVGEQIKQICKNEDSVRGAYLKVILYFFNGIRNSIPHDSGTFFSVNQFNSIKTGIEIAISIAIPCLLPGVGIGMHHLCPSAAKLSAEELTDLQKYERLFAVALTIADCFDEITIRPAILPQLGSLLAVLLQLSHAPLMKPVSKEEKCNANAFTRGKFVMSMDVYNKLKLEQEQFRIRLLSVINVAPRSCIIKELMIILGVRGTPNWLRREAKRLLIYMITKPKGVAALVLSICDGDLDSGLHWSRLEVIAKLIATPQSSNPDGYYNSICSQLLDLLNSNVKDALLVANRCLQALYERNPIVFTERIFNCVAAPLLMTTTVTGSCKILKTEAEVTKSIEDLSKCFLTQVAGSRSVPIKLLFPIAVPLFRLYNKAYRTVYVHRNNIRQLLLSLLNEDSLREDLFLMFLGQNSSSKAYDYGSNWIFQFGANGEFEIADNDEHLDYDELGNCLLNLVHNDAKQSYSLFCSLLKSLSSYDRNYNVKTKSALPSNGEHNTGSMQDIEIKLVNAKMLSILAETSAIQEAHISNPEHLLMYIKTLIHTKCQSSDESDEDGGTGFDVLYIGLMLVKVILSNRPKAMINWEPFNALTISLHHMQAHNTQPELLSLTEEVETLIKTQGASARPRYQDLSEKTAGMTEFDKALQDLADPLLPVRAHGLMSLTKLIERSDPDLDAKKDIVLCLFQENLKHEDPFIYLSAINGIAMLATSYPQKVIELLVHEYVDVTSVSENSTISPDARAKIGEILVKVTRSLGELAPTYKNVLINGFLCGTRDTDPLVRASSLSCLGEICKVLGYRLGNIMTEVLYCIGCIIKTDKIPECRRAAVLVTTLLLQGLGKTALIRLGSDLVPLYRVLWSLRNNDEDPVLRLHAQLALDEFDDIVRNFLFSKPVLEKRIFWLEPTV